MKPQSAKQKGRKFQQQVRDMILAAFPQLEPDDVRSTSMGASGEDLQLSPAARALLGISIECKCVEKVNIWSAFQQAQANTPPYARPMLAIKRNRSDTLAVVQLDFLLELLRRQHG